MKQPINRINPADVAAFEAQVEDIDNFGINLADFYQQISSKSAIYPGVGSPLGLIYCALKLNGEAGELAEHVGKAMRDDNLLPRSKDQEYDGDYAELDGKLTPDRRAAIIKEVGDALWYLGGICRELGIPLSEAMAANLRKLCDRTDRGTLRGSGDDR